MIWLIKLKRVSHLSDIYVYILFQLTLISGFMIVVTYIHATMIIKTNYIYMCEKAV